MVSDLHHAIRNALLGVNEWRHIDIVTTYEELAGTHRVQTHAVLLLSVKCALT